MRASLYHYNRGEKAKRVETIGRGRNQVKAGLLFFDEEDGTRLVSLDPVDVCRRLQSRELEEEST